MSRYVNRRKNERLTEKNLAVIMNRIKAKKTELFQIGVQMGPLPKRKLSKGRRDRRRSHDSLTTANLVQCSNCGEMRLPHTVCSNCGQYQGREVIQIEKEKKS